METANVLPHDALCAFQLRAELIKVSYLRALNSVVLLGCPGFSRVSALLELRETWKKSVACGRILGSDWNDGARGTGRVSRSDFPAGRTGVLAPAGLPILRPTCLTFSSRSPLIRAKNSDQCVVGG